ncbi:hypothetical protein K474DRAFT_1652614 [Panus rudis PR-1116 ss-1]|nr:hypothetical protein K474DRAFT_1652614 [Panus rudis PR-1116 ss-1]
MHRCLQIPDVVRMIAETLAEDDDPDEGPSAVSSFSRTCRAFYDIASDVIWREVTDIRRLLQLLPSENIDRSGHIHVYTGRAPLPSAWDRLLLHGARVRSLMWSHVNDDDRDVFVDANTMRMISIHRPRLYLLPNLQDLVWGENRSNFFDFIYLFLCPSIRTLTVDRSRTARLEQIPPLLLAIPHLCPQLEDISINTQVYDDAVSQATSSLVCSLPSLVGFQSDACISREAVVTMGKSLRLREVALALSPTPELVQDLNSAETALFSGLRFLSCKFIAPYDFEASTNFLELSTSSGEIGTIQIIGHNPPQNIFRQWMEFICKNPDQNRIDMMHLLFQTRRSPADPPDIIPESDLLHLTAFEPMLKLQNLTELRIESDCIDMDDRQLESFVRAFPKMLSLSLVPKYARGRNPKVTLDGLLPIPEACPRLSSLSIAFDATVQPSVEKFHSPNVVSSCVLAYLDVADSPISNAQIVATCLSALFCRMDLRILVGKYTYPETADRVHMGRRLEHGKLWAKVEEYLRVISPARHHERDRARAYVNNLQIPGVSL